MGLVYDNSLMAFIVITLLLAGAAAWMTGRALARTWSAFWFVIIYMLLLALPVRFFHWSLANGTLLSLHLYITDAIILIGIGLASYRIALANQMVMQYPWLYRRTGLFAWEPVREQNVQF